MNKQTPKLDQIKIIAINKKAKFDYQFIETFEAGIVLTGSEIKSLKNSEVNLKESYIKPDSGELFIIGMHIAEYSHSSSKDYNPTRMRKLLMHKSEIYKLQGNVERKGLTIVPVQLYLKKGRAKLQIALAKGKAAPDKRRAIKDSELKKKAERAIKYSK